MQNLSRGNYKKAYTQGIKTLKTHLIHTGQNLKNYGSVIRDGYKALYPLARNQNDDYKTFRNKLQSNILDKVRWNRLYPDAKFDTDKIIRLNSAVHPNLDVNQKRVLRLNMARDINNYLQIK